MSSHDGLPRAFDLSAAAYFLDFVLVPVAVGLAFALSETSWPLIAVGFGIWTLAEYWIHRLVFHGNTDFAPMHELHHALPKDWIGAASWTTFAGFIAFFAAFYLLLGQTAAASLSIGLMLGYLFYCAIHIRMHHGNRAAFDRYTAFMFKHHAGHHRGGNGNFGVSSPIWDIAFGTFERK